ncbi:MAG TPA: LysM domain-containing protein [Candidatus Limnocylindria bacterium]|nr:LysM domain-containing protein [Candidatus Limnocylindria bacterium]
MVRDPNIEHAAAGETLIDIAEIYDVSPSELADANEIEDWNLIYIGQRLGHPRHSARITVARPLALPLTVPEWS